MTPSNIVHPLSVYLVHALAREMVLNRHVNERRSSKVARGYSEYAFSWVIKFITHAVVPIYKSFSPPSIIKVRTRVEVEYHFNWGTRGGDDLDLAMLMKFIAFLKIKDRGSVEIPSTRAVKENWGTLDKVNGILCQMDNICRQRFFQCGLRCRYGLNIMMGIQMFRSDLGTSWDITVPNARQPKSNRAPVSMFDVQVKVGFRI